MNHRGLPWARIATAAAAVTLLGSCAYFNTFYTARKYYDRAAAGDPYPLEKPLGASGNQYAKSIEYSKKVLGFYPRSKWVDDAYLLWARGLLGRDDPIQTVKMLEDFPTRFPESPLIEESKFYLAVGYRQSRKYRSAIRMFDQFLESSPRHKLAPYAHFERSRCLQSLKESAEAALSAGRVIEGFPKHKLVPKARVARAEALFDARQYDAARADFRFMGANAVDDEQRLTYLLREAECLEGARQFDEALVLLKDAISHEREPIRPDTTGGKPLVVQQVPGWDRWGRLQLRIGSVHVASGRIQEAVASYERVIENLPRTPLADEAQYRIGYAWETVGDDFDKARASYQLVTERVGGTGFGIQASERQHNLDRIARFRSQTGDSALRESETAFLLAELYLFQLEKPERALEEYRKLAGKFPGTPLAGKAMNAEAWVLSRKLNRADEADSLFWKVVHGWPGTEAQIAARDYLEERGHQVPDSLIRLPEPPPPDTLDRRLSEPPSETPRLGEVTGPGSDPDAIRMPVPPPLRLVSPDSLVTDPGMGPVRRDSAGSVPTSRDSILRRSGVPDSLFRKPVEKDK